MKPATTLDKQLEILKSRGLLIDDDNEVLTFLRHNNYYRFSGITKKFMNNDDSFFDEIKFSDLKDIYFYDSLLRNFINKYLEVIEIRYKTLLAYHLSLNSGPLFYKDIGSFNFGEEEFNDYLGKIKEDVEKMNKSETFAEHFGEDIPCWALVELLSFGTITKLYKNLKTNCLSELIKSLKRIDEEHLKTSLISISVLRNICAHRGRLFYKGFSFAPKLSNKTIKALKSCGNPNTNNRSLFIFMCSILELLNNYKDGEIFIDELINVIDNAPSLVDKYRDYGFFENWKNVLYQINFDNKE